MDFHEIVITDHRGFIVDVTLEDFFNINSNYVDKIEANQINSHKLSHKTKFTEKLDEVLDEMNLKYLLDEYCNQYSSYKILELIDNKIITVLNKVRKFVEGPK